MPGPRRDFGPKQKVENPVKVFKRIMSYVLKRYPVHCLLVLICIVVSVYANVQGTMFMKTLIDGYITPLLGQANPDYSELLQAIIKMGILYAIGIAATFGNTKIMVYVTQGTMRNIRNDMFKHMESLPIKYFDTHKHGDIMSMYTNDVDTLRQMVSQSIPQFINSLISIVNVLIYMIILSVPLTLVSIVMVMLVIWASKTAASKSGKFFVSQQKNIGALNGFIEEMMDGQKVVKVFCHEDESIERFDQLNNDLYASAYNANRYANILGPINVQLGNLSYVVVAIVGGLVAINGIGGFTLGSLASFLTLNKSFQQPINQISNQLNSIVMALAGGDRIFRLLDEKPEVDDGYVTLTDAVVNADGTITESNKRTGTWAWKHYHKAEGTTDYRQLKGDVVFEHVDFGYNDDKMVLHDVSLYAQPGQKIAFVGSTGAGKTTITNLINRFYDIQSGKIRYDGINIGKIKKDDLRHSLGIVLQDTHLFTGTVMENIRYGKLEATDEEVIEAAKIVSADQVAKRLEKGWQTDVGEGGDSMSTGEKQLISFARAVLADPAIFVLDEATSSIDTETEQLIQNAISYLLKDRTSFIIAHRLSTIRQADVILVVKAGKIIEQGTHDELMAMKGYYHDLYTQQFKEEMMEELVI